MRIRVAVLTALCAAWTGSLAAEALKVDLSKVPAAASRPVDFVKDIQPLIEKSCINCHGPERPKHKFSMQSRQTLIQGGKSETPGLVVGKSDKSLLVHVIADAVENDDYKMPPLGKREKYPALTPAQVGLVRAWIDQGAKWPEGLVLKPKD